MVLNREFRYLWLYEAMVAEGMPFVVRLNTGNRARITDGEGKPVALWLRPGEQVFLEGVYHLGKVRGNLAGVWEKGWREPLWVFTSLTPAEGRKVYRQRMKDRREFPGFEEPVAFGEDHEQEAGEDGADGGVGAFGLCDGVADRGGPAGQDVWGKSTGFPRGCSSF